MAWSWVQLLAAVMVVTNAATWVLASRWERPGHRLEVRERLPVPALVERAGDVAQVVPLAYPVLVVAAPRWAYEGGSWSTPVDLPVQVLGAALWTAGVAVALWASRTIGGYGAVGAVVVGHRLVSEGPYRLVRHPIYTAMTALATGTALAFRSYLLLGVAAVTVVTHVWWAVAEERLLGSAAGLGDEYRAYAARTGRFLPRVTHRS